MKCLFLPIILFAGLTAAILHGEESTSSSVKFSKPDQPETVRISILHGSIKVSANETNDTVTVTTSARGDKKSKARPDGLRVIGTSASFSIAENENVVDINYGVGSRSAPDASFVITIPKQAALKMSDEFGGEMSVDGLLGDLEIKNLNGEVRLNNIGGGAVVETMNGEIRASFSALTPGKALSFSSMNGEVELHLPALAKANLRFRTQNGSILTDFPEDVLTTKGEALIAPEAPDPQSAREVARATAQSDRLAAEVGRRAEAIRQAAEESARDASAAAPHATPVPVRVPRPFHVPRPPMIPALVGGKVVSGTLNGGGTDVQISTMNGDIIVRNTPKAP